MFEKVTICRDRMIGHHKEAVIIVPNLVGRLSLDSFLVVGFAVYSP